MPPRTPTQQTTTCFNLDTLAAEMRDISRALGPVRVGESLLDQALRARAILDRWQDLAHEHLGHSPQLDNTCAGADLGSRHFELRGFIGGELRAAKERLASATESTTAWQEAAQGHAAEAMKLRVELAEVREAVAALQTDASMQGAPLAQQIGSIPGVVVLRQVRAALITPEGESIITHAKAMAEENTRLKQRLDAIARITAG